MKIRSKLGKSYSHHSSQKAINGALYKRDYLFLKFSQVCSFLFYPISQTYPFYLQLLKRVNFYILHKICSQKKDIITIDEFTPLTPLYRSSLFEADLSIEFPFYPQKLYPQPLEHSTHHTLFDECFSHHILAETKGQINFILSRTSKLTRVTFSYSLINGKHAYLVISPKSITCISCICIFSNQLICYLEVVPNIRSQSRSM